MKKIGLLLCFLTISLLTGCGGKNKLVCESKKDENTYVTVKYDFTFDNDKVDYYDLEFTYDFTDIEDLTKLGCESLSECIEKSKNTLNKCLEEESLENCKITKEEETRVVITANVTEDYLNSDSTDFTRKTTKDEIIKVLEAQDFTCK